MVKISTINFTITHDDDLPTGKLKGNIDASGEAMEQATIALINSLGDTLGLTPKEVCDRLILIDKLNKVTEPLISGD